MPLDHAPATGMSFARHMAIHVDGAETPPHAFDADGHHFSHQDYQFRKQLCLHRPDHHKGASATSGQNATKEKAASDDAARDELVKWQYYNHRRTSNPTMTCLLQPGHHEEGDQYWGIIREDRKSDLPHWSQRQFDMKKDHHTARIHKNEKGKSEVNNVSTNAAHYLHPEETKKTNIFGESGLAHGHNSYAHFCVQRRRHQQPVDNTEANHRSTHPPLPSHRSHFFTAPEPQATCSYLLPEGPSVTAKHIPKHFVNNVVWQSPEHDPYSARVCNNRHSVARRYADGERTVTSEITRSHPPEHRHRMAPCATPRPEEGGTRGKRRSKSSEAYQFYNTPGRPPHPDTVDMSTGRVIAKNHDSHVYRSHAQLMYDKQLCHTDLTHSSRWERLEQGSPGHSAGGSVFSSLAGGAGEPHERREKRSRSVEQTQKPRRIQPTSARAASSDRSGRSRTGQSSRRRGA